MAQKLAAPWYSFGIGSRTFQKKLKFEESHIYHMKWFNLWMKSMFILLCVLNHICMTYNSYYKCYMKKKLDYFYLLYFLLYHYSYFF